MYDPEVPAGFQDADIATAELIQANAATKSCNHGWMIGKAGNPEFNATAEEINLNRAAGRFPDRPTDPSVQSQADIPDGLVLCLDCGVLVEDRYLTCDWCED